MASSLLSTSQIAELTGVYSRHFETFSHERTRIITIYREPIKVVTTPTQVVYPGYSNNYVQENISYTSVSAEYPAIVHYIEEQMTESLLDVKAETPGKAKIKIKVEEDAKNYIDGAKVEKIIVDGITCNLTSDKGVRSFLGLKYYYYILNQTT